MPLQSKHKQIKVCVICISLSKGGAEKSTAILTQMLDNSGHEVHLVTLNNDITYNYAGTLFNLGKYKSSNPTKSQQLLNLFRLRRYIVEQKFDYIIDNRNRQFSIKEFIYSTFIYRSTKVIYVTRSFNLNQYFPANKWVAQRMLKEAHALVGVSKAIAKHINTTYGITKAVSIYNPVDSTTLDSSILTNSSRYIIYVGRIEEKVKNHTLLLESFLKSQLISHGYKLKIIGSGTDEEWLKKKIESMSLQEFVELTPFTNNIYPFIREAKFLVLTSHYEGFPRVLIEALSQQTPVISVNCKSGPSEIIKNKINGLLVENHQPKLLADAMDSFLMDEKLYNNCKKNTLTSIEHLTPERIASHWNKILQNE